MSDHRCRLCSVNDREALVEELAEKMWESRRDREIDPPWDGAGPYWQGVMRGFARTTMWTFTGVQ
jgi:hypothetical protein